MLPSRLWLQLFGLRRAVLVGVREEAGRIVIRVCLRRRDRGRCGLCGRRSPGYDRGVGVRRWRTLDLGLTFAFIEAEAPRRFRERAEEIRGRFTELAHRWDPELGGIEVRDSPELDALEGIGLAAAAAVRQFGQQPLWSLVAAASGGRLLSNTSCPLPLLT